MDGDGRATAPKRAHPIHRDTNRHGPCALQLDGHQPRPATIKNVSINQKWFFFLVCAIRFRSSFDKMASVTRTGTESSLCTRMLRTTSTLERVFFHQLFARSRSSRYSSQKRLHSLRHHTHAQNNANPDCAR